MGLLHFLPVLAGLVCLLYGGQVGLLSGFGFGSAWWVWPAAAACLFTLVWYYSRKRQGRLKRDLPDSMKIVLLTSAVLFLAVFLLAEGLVIRDHRGREPEERPEFLLVLGAKTRGTEPSRILRERLDAAVAYHREHPGCVIIVCGGQGADEEFAEADVMAYYLLNNGVPDDMIREESNSTNTYENLENAEKLLYNKNAQIVLITSDFHLFRAMRMAENLGYTKVAGVAAPSFQPLRVHYMVREFLSIAKSFLMGQL